MIHLAHNGTNPADGKRINRVYRAEGGKEIS